MSTEYVVRLSDTKPQGTDGGTFIALADRTRDLNTIDAAVDFCELSRNKFTLEAGTYLIKAAVPAYGVGLHRAVLRNMTEDHVCLVGSVEWAEPHGLHSVINGTITITEKTAFEIQHQHMEKGSGATNGFGKAFNDGTETYTTVEIRLMEDSPATTDLHAELKEVNANLVKLIELVGEQNDRLKDIDYNTSEPR